MQAIPRCSDCLIARSIRNERPFDHIAFAIGLAHYEPERKRLESLGLKVEVREHAWIKWRSLCFHDPEVNELELVCYDENLK
jgi:hypothetical protein